ncbi:MAG: ribosomal L7Ae/L30e/S12e/Gadd45 family protein [Nitrosopumilaceae archaeon]|jgi:large subunit ribosomal protein L30e|nr:ribosomal L7Ae/L30e/S12e/Gadd45 family protein [Nitrososphaerota archaeon]
MKLLEKALKDAMKEKKRSLGTKQVLNSIKSSKLIVMSQSVPKNTAKTIQEEAKKQKVSTVQFEGTSVALGRLCGLQFRVSTISLTSVSDANIKSILKESETK